MYIKCEPTMMKNKNTTDEYFEYILYLKRNELLFNN
jgi:hypothetical protein